MTFRIENGKFVKEFPYREWGLGCSTVHGVEENKHETV